MTRPLTIALMRSGFDAEATGGRVFEEELLTAALGASTPHKFVLYPRIAADVKRVEELGVGHRVSFVKQLMRPLLPRRVLRRAKRAVLRRAKATAVAELTAVLRKAGADCAWMLGGTLTPLDMPYVGTLWDLQHRVQPWFPEVSNNGEWHTRERLNAEFVRRAAAILVGTPEGARQVREAYGDAAGALSVVPLPTPSFAIEAGMRPKGKRPLDLPANYLLYPAQFWPHKNHLTAVRAMAALVNPEYAPHLVFVGNDRGNKQHVMDAARALGVEHRIQTPGFVPTERLIALYQHADAVLFPSLFGPDNLPPLEAMALGCPVVAARVPGAAEQLGDAAMLVDPFDAEGFAAAIHAVHDHPMRTDAMLARGRELARSRTTGDYAATVLDIFNSRIAPVRPLWP